MNYAVFLGGTKGLGFELAKHASEFELIPVIYGTSATQLKNNSETSKPAFYYDIDLTTYDLDNFRVGHKPIKYLFWIAGAFLKKPLTDTSDYELTHMTNLHFINPLRVIREAIKEINAPFHLVTIASCSSWRLREDETVYCALKSAQAAFTRNVAVELIRDYPGSQVTLINPGGLKTVNFWKDYTVDASGFLDPKKVAHIIWKIIRQQSEKFKEVQILRRKPIVAGSEPIIEYGAKAPEGMTTLMKG